MNVQVDHTTYNDISYNDKGRFNSFWHQIDEVLKFKPTTVLEIGTGNGFAKYILEKSNVRVTTVDIDKELHPDIHASVLSLPIEDNSYDVALCCQVLEHIPYENFIPALTEINRVVKDGLILSLPDLQRVYRFNLQLPVFGEIKFLYRMPRFKAIKWEFNGEHYWNISCKGYSLNRIKKDIENSGFVIENTFSVFEMSWHRFFILRKRA
jgi:ubiquinone/menaquinone biosynthesis C-methylase UbiE